MKAMFDTRCIIGIGAVLLAATSGQAGERIDFGRDIAPIFAKHCVRSHDGRENEQQQG